MASRVRSSLDPSANQLRQKPVQRAKLWTAQDHKRALRDSWKKRRAKQAKRTKQASRVRQKSLKRTPLKRAGRKTKEWESIRRVLVKRFKAAGITKCEVREPGCWRDNGLGFLHYDKRRFLTPAELWITILGCNHCEASPRDEESGAQDHRRKDGSAVAEHYENVRKILLAILLAICFLDGMTAKKKLNVRLLRRIQKHILEEPRRFFMEGVVITGVPGKKFNNDGRFTDLASLVPACGTAACIHGWTALLSGKSPFETSNLTFQWSAERLGMQEGSGGKLFLADAWPEPFATRYANATRPSRRAEIAAARIEHLIKTGE